MNMEHYQKVSAMEKYFEIYEYYFSGDISTAQDKWMDLSNTIPMPSLGLGPKNFMDQLLASCTEYCNLLTQDNEKEILKKITDAINTAIGNAIEAKIYTNTKDYEKIYSIPANKLFTFCLARERDMGENGATMPVFIRLFSNLIGKRVNNDKKEACKSIGELFLDQYFTRFETVLLSKTIEELAFLSKNDIEEFDIYNVQSKLALNMIQILGLLHDENIMINMAKYTNNQYITLDYTFKIVWDIMNKYDIVVFETEQHMQEDNSEIPDSIDLNIEEIYIEYIYHFIMYLSKLLIKESKNSDAFNPDLSLEEQLPSALTILSRFRNYATDGNIKNAKQRIFCEELNNSLKF